MELNEIKYGFKLVSKKELNDIGSVLFEYEHLKSKGKVAYLKNDDTNCCFAIGFRTLPQDSTGVCHIIEHSVLCGSEKYPLKEPFVNLLKTSLATFLNAFTAYDWTMYPFASQTPKDFDNILSIYLDAVFNPLSMKDPKPFLQEGWHLELNSKDELPQYKGVVYNEMKGAMSSVDEVLTQSTLEAMYKDTFYRFNSGGDPDVIPELTYEQYKAFHKKHYTPQNAMTYFYGDLDIEEKLKFLDEEYFSKFDGSNEEIVIIPQEPFVDLSFEKDYEIGADEDEKDNTYMSLCYGLGHYSNYEENLAMSILCDVLLGKNDSPLKKALLDAKLGQNVVYSIDDDNIIPALHIYLQKTNKNTKKQFKEIFEKEVKKQVEFGIDKEQLLAAINFSEFKDKEMDMGRMPKGLIFAMNMMGSFNYNDDLSSRFEVFKYYDLFKKEMNNGYFEKLLEKYILNSNHHVQVVINPSKTLGAEKKQKMDELMKSIKENMSEEEIEETIKQTQELLAYQNHVDTKEELATLPSLDIKDIPTSVNYLPSKETTIKQMKAITHTLNTNKIAYLRMYFGLDCVNYDELPYVSLLRTLLLNVSTKKYSVLELSSLIKTYLGGMSFSLPNVELENNNSKPYFAVGTSALVENVKYIPVVLNEVLLRSKFTKKEIKRILQQMLNNIRQTVIGSGNSVASMMASSKFSTTSNYDIMMSSGPVLYEIYNKMLKEFNYKEISTKLYDLTKRIFTKENVLLSLSGDKETTKSLKEVMKKVKLNKEKPESVLKPRFNETENEALIIPSGVSYNAMAVNLDKYGIKYNGAFNVLTHIVNYDYLWSEVRVKGGAYGCGMGINKFNKLAMTTYRDPNVTNSYNVFNNLPKYIESLKLNKEEFKNYIIGALGGFDVPVSTPLTINVADAQYLSGVTKQDRIRVKKEVLKANLKELKKLAKPLQEALNDAVKYTVGNETKIKEYNFDKTKTL